MSKSGETFANRSLRMLCSHHDEQRPDLRDMNVKHSRVARAPVVVMEIASGANTQLRNDPDACSGVG